MNSSTELPALFASTEQQQINNTQLQLLAQTKLIEAREKLRLEHTEAAKAVVDPPATKPPRLTARQRAKYPKLTAADDILTLGASVASNPWARLSSSEQYLLQPDPPSVEPFYAQLEEIPLMLKSTHKPAARLGPPPLPEGWTEHKAPTGQPYYHNDSTKQSTYTRPLPALQPVVQYSKQAEGIGNHPYDNGISWRGRGNSRGGLANQQRPQPKDRSKLKYDIPGYEPWVLVKTKLGRRFVYNSERDESFWRIPPDVMKGVQQLDRQEREKQTTRERVDVSDAEDNGKTANGTPTVAPAPETSLATNQETKRFSLNSDSEEYEEVEVTDDEDEENPSKRQKTEENIEQSVEFNEDDIAFQLAAMGQDYGLDPGEYGDDGGEELLEGAEGLALTEEDAKALFKDMLNDKGTSPYMTWEKVIEVGYVVEDERYTVLPNMRSRKEVWGEWTRETIQHLKEQREKEEKKDPKIPYFAFLQKNATPKLYWPEFRRKYKKEPEMHNKISDKDREKWYREYIGRLKLPEATLKSDLVKLLKSIPLYALNKSITIHALPTILLTDIRYISLRPAIRDPLIEAHISTLPPAPSDLQISPEEQEAQAKERQERQRRQEALAERQRQVQDEKRKQNGALRYSKGMLREGEEELQRAMRIGKEGLLGHMAEKE